MPGDLDHEGPRGLNEAGEGHLGGGKIFSHLLFPWYEVGPF